MIRIVHVITSLSDGGAEAMLYQLCTTSGSHRHAVIALTGRGKYEALLKSRGIPVVCLHMPRGIINITGVCQLFLSLYALRPSVIQTWMYHSNLLGGVVGRLAMRRRIVWGIHHSNLDPQHTKFTTRLTSRICALISGRIPTKIIACGQMPLAIHVQAGYDFDRMISIPNGYDLRQYVPSYKFRIHQRCKLDVDEQMPVIGMVARFNSQKDHGNLIKSLGLLVNARLEFRVVLIGVDVESTNLELQTQLCDAGVADKVFLLGCRDDVPALMNAMDIHVLSSLSEGFPNVVAEAMACGTPCVVTDVGDAADIVGDTGWVVPARNPQALADALAQALDAWRDRPAWQQRQTAARSRIRERFSLHRMCAAYVRVWREALAVRDA
jgi:glycosyltransferase involved in cell wall biosynthesis